MAVPKLRSEHVGDRLAVLWDDLQEPAVLGQFAVLAFCLAAGWWLARRLLERPLRERLRKQAEADGTITVGAAPVPGAAHPRGVGAAAAVALRAGIDALVRALWPLASLLLVLAARPLLERFHKASLLDVAVPLLGSFALLRALVYAAQRSFPNSAWLGPVLRTVAACVWVGVALHLAGLAQPVVDALDGIVLPLGKNRVSVLVVLQATLTVAVSLLLALWAGSAIESRLMRAGSLDSSLRAVLARVLRAVLLLVAVLVALSSVGLDLTVLSVFGGALGVGLGLGLQRIASNYVSGFIILLDRGLRIGDQISVDKYSGRVTQIKTRYTVLRSPDGTEAVVPNELLVAQPVLNHSFADPKVRLAIQLALGYDADIDRAFELMRAAAAAHPRILDDPAPAAFVSGFNPDGLAVELAFWIKDAELGTLPVRSDVSREVLAALRAAGVPLPRPPHEPFVSAAAAPVAGPGKALAGPVQAAAAP